MGGSGFSREKFNTREEFITSDLNRAQALASRDAQNLLADASNDVTGVPLSGLSGPCILTGIASTYLMALSAAQALVYNLSDSSLTADDSPYEVARWLAQNLTFANPSGANPRIDLVVVTPAMVDTDSQSRTVLVDPVARTVTPQNVFKTTNPQATVAVVTGTPASSPVPPAVPAGAFALFEVFVPTSAADATAFSVVPRMFRRAPFPWSTLSAVVSGFVPQWDLSVTPTTTDSALSFSVLDDARIVIDGELIEILGLVLAGAISQDAGSNNPFASAAPSGWHKPYYIYAVGGRHAPQLDGTGNNSPIAIVESLVPPLLSTGHPTSAITTPRGTTTQLGAVYIGLGFVMANTTKRLPCVQGDEFTRVSATSTGAIESIAHTPTTTGYEAFDINTPPVVPVVSRQVLARLTPGSGGAGIALAAPDNGLGTAPAPAFISSGGFETPLIAPNVGGTRTFHEAVIPVNAAAPKFWVASPTGIGNAELSLLAFDHGVKRLR